MNVWIRLMIVVLALAELVLFVGRDANFWSSCLVVGGVVFAATATRLTSDRGLKVLRCATGWKALPKWWWRERLSICVLAMGFLALALAAHFLVNDLDEPYCRVRNCISTFFGEICAICRERC